MGSRACGGTGDIQEGEERHDRSGGGNGGLVAGQRFGHCSPLFRRPRSLPRLLSWLAVICCSTDPPGPNLPMALSPRWGGCGILTPAISQADDGDYASLISDMISALLKYNSINIDEGFEEFDRETLPYTLCPPCITPSSPPSTPSACGPHTPSRAVDGDGKLSLSDVQTAAVDLQMDVETTEVIGVHIPLHLPPGITPHVEIIRACRHVNFTPRVRAPCRWTRGIGPCRGGGTLSPWNSGRLPSLLPTARVF